MADDRVNLILTENDILMSAPPNLEGKLEIRGLGIVQVACAPSAPLTLICDLISSGQIERLPEVKPETVFYQPVSRVIIDGSTTSAAVKVLYALKVALGEIGLIT